LFVFLGGGEGFKKERKTSVSIFLQDKFGGFLEAKKRKSGRAKG